jgi:hypothetical protein
MYFHSPSRGARHRGDSVTDVWSKAVLNWFEWNLHSYATHWLATRWSGTAAQWFDLNPFSKSGFNHPSGIYNCPLPLLHAPPPLRTIIYRKDKIEAKWKRKIECEQSERELKKWKGYFRFGTPRWQLECKFRFALNRKSFRRNRRTLARGLLGFNPSCCRNRISSTAVRFHDASLHTE